jgi:Mn-dependent DtxR family transcriptional regulator
MNQLIPASKRLTPKEWKQLERARARQAIIEELESNPKLSSAEISRLFGISPTSATFMKKCL